MKYSYLLEGNDFLSIQTYIDEITRKLEFQDATINFYDMDEVLLENALEDLDTYSFLTNKKVVVIRNLENINLDEYKKDWEHLLKYISFPNPAHLLIATVTKLDERKKTTKELKNVFEYIKISVSPLEYVKQELYGFEVENGVYLLLAETCKNDITKIHQECCKLKNYCFDSKKIMKNDIEELVVKKLGDATEITFAFSRALAERNKKNAIQLYQELLTYQIEPLSILGLLASQIRIIYQVKKLQERHLSNDEIAKILKEKSSYRVSKTKELTRSFNEKELLNLMIQLEEIDLKIKSESVDPNFLIEVFIFNL